MENKTKATITNGTATAVSIAAPLAATITQFPIWQEAGADATAGGIALSGAFVVFAIISLIPALKGLKAKLKNPGAFLMWGFFFAVVWALAPIINQLKVITLVGIASNGGSFILGKLATYLNNKGQTTDGKLIRDFLQSTAVNNSEV